MPIPNTLTTILRVDTPQPCGLTQREVAGVLNLKSGVAVSCQIRKLRKTLEEDEELKGRLDKIAGKLGMLQGQS